jgi:hypothetical protein
VRTHAGRLRQQAQRIFLLADGDVGLDRLFEAARGFEELARLESRHGVGEQGRRFAALAQLAEQLGALLVDLGDRLLDAGVATRAAFGLQAVRLLLEGAGGVGGLIAAAVVVGGELPQPRLFVVPRRLGMPLQLGGGLGGLLPVGAQLEEDDRLLMVARRGEELAGLERGGVGVAVGDLAEHADQRHLDGAPGVAGLGEEPRRLRVLPGLGVGLGGFRLVARPEKSLGALLRRSGEVGEELRSERHAREILRFQRVERQPRLRTDDRPPEAGNARRAGIRERRPTRRR